MAFDAEDLVDQYYRHDPETEILLPGGHLKNGMYVLIEDSSCRADKRRSVSNPASFLWELAFRNNRWCEVTHLCVTEDDGREYVSFIGLYDDHTQYHRKFQIEKAWYVKKDSIPRSWWRKLFSRNA